MNAIYYLCCILLLAHLHDRAFGMKKFTGGEITKGDFSEAFQRPLLESQLQTPEEKPRRAKGILGNLFKGKQKGQTSSEKPIVHEETEERLMARWVGTIYLPSYCKMFLGGTVPGNHPPVSFTELARNIEPVRELQRKRQSADSGTMATLANDVVNHMIELKGENNDELAQIATCAKALYKLNLEKGHRKPLYDKLDTYIRSQGLADDRIKLLLGYLLLELR
ncbi:hypothetical protein PTTG_12320 [Puccinia triticina 1-1 BBBD Race 1]|uniref:Uncharacterized protein n=2 Tax=Puccinia triticina TaxID=208348 RepID=A0A180GFA1_PUCT1|nr:uncharacterized protein PtA15_3A353 [Puccinia triticina]OAV91397.1 hypothetical protein PTTG_12320 [Puccinia triticina 1-1 BBBD Race 1]WAQ82987.1 hypothetical protein PtA15_3A353 [Puccinia triticina]WAR53814.1 hypothetical protein PtB15_3B323 [Puccinia triticina]